MAISLFKPQVCERAIDAVTDVLRSGELTQGTHVVDFERKLKEFLGCKHFPLTLNSASSGLTLALHLLKEKTSTWPGFQEGDEILTPALTCTATNWPIIQLGLRGRWLDSDPLTGSVSLNDIRLKLTKKTKVVQIMHWGGSAVDVLELDKILEEARPELGFKPYLIEDCAHAFGAQYPSQGNLVGNNRRDAIQVFSFQAIKVLTSGDGGCIVLPTQELFVRAKLLRWFGISREARGGQSGRDLRMEDPVMEAGWKFHMNNINAALGMANLGVLPAILEKTRANAKQLREQLKNVEVTVLAPEGPHASHWLFTVLLPSTVKKATFISAMEALGVTTSQVHLRNDLHPCTFDSFAEDSHLPGVDELSERMVCLPVGAWLSSTDITQVASCVEQVILTSSDFPCTSVQFA
jgi:dTDP-4-amino-4,6-dideoxygalactose transaminase